MRFPPREIALRDGRTCVLQPPAPEFAEAMIDYLKAVAAETPWLLRCPEEVTYTPEDERGHLLRMLGDPRAAMLTALVDGRIAGNSSIDGHGPKRKLSHRCTMGIAIRREFWGLGLGAAMIAALEDLARQIGYEQMDLEVNADNVRALALYRRCGFEETGRRVRAVRFDDGTYHDELLMTKFL